MSKVTFALMFELSVNQTIDFLNISPWDDIIMNAGGTTQAQIYAYIATTFRVKFEQNLSASFAGLADTNTGPCSGVQGFVPFYQVNCQ